MPLEACFDAAFTASLALREKQIQQSYRPVIGVHKVVRPPSGDAVPESAAGGVQQSGGSRAGLLSSAPLLGRDRRSVHGVGATPLIEANPLGFHVVGTDINPMACWIVRQELSPLDDPAFVAAAEVVTHDVQLTVVELYRSRCVRCGGDTTVSAVDAARE